MKAVTHGIYNTKWSCLTFLLISLGCLDDSFDQDEELPSPTSSEKSHDETTEQNANEAVSVVVDGFRIKTEPHKAEEAETSAPENESEENHRESPKRKRNDEVHLDENDGQQTPAKFLRALESPGIGTRKLHPNPMDLLVRAFPNHCRSVLDCVLHGCSGNVVQAIECLLQNQEKKYPPISVPMPIMAPLSRDIHPGIHPASHLFPKHELFPYPLHKHTPSPTCRIPPPPPLLKPKPQVRAFPFSMEAVLAHPPAPGCAGSPKTENPSTIHFCCNCGRKASITDNFCAFCGYKLY